MNRRPLLVSALSLALVAAGTLARLTDEAAVALTGGVDSPDTPLPNATVNVNGASGTLIAPDLVVTNGHVARVGLPAATPPFSRTDAHNPAVWHPIPAGGVTVVFGAGVGPQVIMTRSEPLNSPRTRFEVDDRNGGRLLSGDFVGLKTRGFYLFVNGGALGGDLRVDSLFDRWGTWQRLTIEKVSGAEGDEIRGGDRIALRARDGSYLGAVRRNGTVVADSTSRDARHEFTILTFEGRGAMSNDPISHEGLVAISSRNAGFMQAPYRVAGVQIATPGLEDIALIRLNEAVPGSVARPVRLKLRLGPDDEPSPDEFYGAADLFVAGYGTVAGGVATTWRQQGRAGNATRETPLGTNPELFTRYRGAAGRVSTQLNDSGGSWFIDTPEGRILVGITQQVGNNFLSPMYRGGVDSGGNSKPDVHAWFSMFLADDDCVSGPQDIELGRLPGQDGLWAATVCRFGAAGSPFAVAYPGTPFTFRTESCVSFDRSVLSLLRPATPEGTGSDAWTMVAGPQELLTIPGTWQQSYTRGRYLMSFLQRMQMNRMCSWNRSGQREVYFRA